MDLVRKVEFLRDPRAYRGRTRQVDAIETHMSWLFLTDTRAFKLKKPVTYPFLDFSTLARRKFFCEEELRLNRRLAAATYRRIVPLRCSRSGHLSLHADIRHGRVVDWLVEMRRLPAAAMLDVTIGEGRLSLADVEALAARLAAFYARCDPVIADGELYLRNLAREQRINRAILLRPEFGLTADAGPALDAVDRALAELTPAIVHRVDRGYVVEGHGDLRPEHVCLAPPMQVIDALEFNRAMRIVDPYDEVGYLGLECDMLGADWVSPVLIGLLSSRLGHPPGLRLTAFYRAFRALLRARLCMAHLLDAKVSRAARWRPLARRYIAAALRECFSLRSQAGPTAAHLRRVA